MQICSSNVARSTLLALAFLLALSISACGSDEGPSGTADGPNPAELTPAEAPIYVEASVRPQDELADNLMGSLSKLLDTDDPGGQLVAELEKAIQADSDYADISYADDVEPWLGETAGIFLTEFSADAAEGAALISYTDEGAAEDAVLKFIEAANGEEPNLEEQTYKETAYQLDPDDGGAYTLIDDFLVVGTEAGIKAAVDAAAGENLAGNTDATDELNEVRDGSAISSLLDVESLLDALVENGDLPEESREQIEAQLGKAAASGQIGFGLGAASPDALTFDAVTPVAEGSVDPPGTLVEVGGDAWLAFVSGNVGEKITENLEALDAQLQAQAPAADDIEIGGQGRGRGGSGGDAEVAPPQSADELFEQLGLDPEEDLGWIGDASFYVQGGQIFTIGAGLKVEATDEGQARDALGKLRGVLDDDPNVQTEPLEEGDGFRIGAAGLPVTAEVELRDGEVGVAIGSVDVDAVLSPEERLGDSEEFNMNTEALDDGLKPTLYLDFETVLSLVEASGQADPQLDQARGVLETLDVLVAGAEIADGRSRLGIVLGIKESPSGGEAAVIAP